jgi:hypothetical protein
MLGIGAWGTNNMWCIGQTLRHTWHTPRLVFVGRVLKIMEKEITREKWTDKHIRTIDLKTQITCLIRIETYFFEENSYHSKVSLSQIYYLLSVGQGTFI